MNIQEGYNSNKKTVSFGSQERLDNKIDKFSSMMSKLSAQGSNQNRPFKLKFIKNKGEDKVENIVIKINTDQTVEKDTVHCHMEVDCSLSKITEEILGKEILEKHKIIEVKISGEDIVVVLGTVILTEVGVGLGKVNFGVTLGEMMEVPVDQDQVLEQVPIEIELDVLNVGNVTTLTKLFKHVRDRK